MIILIIVWGVLLGISFAFSVINHFEISEIKKQIEELKRREKA